MYFRESRLFINKWIKLPILLSLVSVNLFFLAGTYKQIYPGKSFGSQSMSDAGLIQLTTAILLGTGLLHFLISSLQLELEIDSYSVKYHLYPFHLHTIRIDMAQIESMNLEPPKAIRQYGGFGIRYKSGTKAYLLGGKYGLSICLKNGKKILIDIQNQEALQQLLETRHSNIEST